MHTTLKAGAMVASLPALLLTLAATDAVAEDCQSVYVIGNAREVVECPANQKFDYCIVRTNLIDRAGLLTGQLEFFEDSSTGAKHPQDPSVAIYAAEGKITTEEGVLEFAERGVFDTKSLEFAGLAAITGGSGQLEGSAGTLTNIGNSEGTLQMTGVICRE